MNTGLSFAKTFLTYRSLPEPYPILLALFFALGCGPDGRHLGTEDFARSGQVLQAASPGHAHGLVSARLIGRERRKIDERH